MGKPNFSAELPETTLRQIDDLKPLFNGNKTQIIIQAVKLLHQQESKTMKATVTNRNNKQLDFDAAVNMMDDDIREQLANRQEWHSNQDFFAAYEIAHEQKYGEEWELSKPNPTW